MTVIKSGLVRFLLAANGIVLVLFLTGVDSARGDEWETFCPPSAAGCDCITGSTVLPNGCYDNLGDEFLCSSNQYCNEPE